MLPYKISLLKFIICLSLISTINIYAGEVEDHQEKCYCISKAKENDGNASGAGIASGATDYSCMDFKMVPRNTCISIYGGELSPSSNHH
jgi:uncharacterized membrane protein